MRASTKTAARRGGEPRNSRRRLRRPAGVLLAVLATLPAASARAQSAQQVRRADEPASAVSTSAASRPTLAAREAQLDSLVAHARSVNPAVRAARERAAAARARVTPAGQLPDPMIGVGVMNLPVREPGFREEMTMWSVAGSQLLPFPGKLAQQRRAMEAELAAAEAMADAGELDVALDVRAAYYELAFADGALEIIGRNQTLLNAMIEAGSARYAVSLGAQQDVLIARTEAARVAQEAVTLVEQRHAATARLNAALDRDTEAEVPAAAVPGWIVAAASPAGGRPVAVAAALGTRAPDSPLPSLRSLQDRAVALNPELRAHAAAISAQAARVALAEKQHLPDVELSAQYGVRSGRNDVVSFMASVPLPVRRGSKQAAEVTASRAELAALEAEHRERVNALRARVAEVYADLERARTHGVLFTTTIIPQGRATFETIRTALETGRADLALLLEQQATLYSYELAQLRALTDFALKLAALERAVGGEVLR